MTDPSSTGDDSNQRPIEEVEMLRALAGAVSFARRTQFQNAATPWSTAEHVAWSLQNDGWKLVRDEH